MGLTTKELVEMCRKTRSYTKRNYTRPLGKEDTIEEQVIVCPPKIQNGSTIKNWRFYSRTYY